ncbi:D-beta-hydroxybutyrate dehydrogenase, mitochondrial [Lepisosteus oculatus]|uniref:D-beta-hydroxybutyrate dehydrogenase, mitochondrial n=1 Tax=Lepisosteus oculatus TaxID=7918 RepID=UPI0035F507F1
MIRTILEIAVVFATASLLYFFGYLTPAFIMVPLVIFLLAQAESYQFNPEGRAVFITGCDSGFGYQLAKRLDKMGFLVFAGCQFPERKGACDLVNECSSRLKVTKLDVTKDEDVAQAKKFIQTNLPEKGLWGIVNNAGISDWSETQWNNIEHYHKMADVNLFGSIRTTLPFISLIRASQGRMVFVSSILAFFYAPNMGPYSITKRAVEAFADCLRVEMACFGVKVSIIQPGNFGSVTNILQEKMAEDIWNRFDEEQKQTFNRQYIELVTEYATKLRREGIQDINMVIDAMVDALTSRRPKTRYLVVNMFEKVLFYAFPYWPTFLADAVFSLGDMYQKRKLLLFSPEGN